MVQGVLESSQSILRELQSYVGASEEIRLVGVVCVCVFVCLNAGSVFVGEC